VTGAPAPLAARSTGGIDLAEALIACWAADGGSKSFLITIGDRSVTGLVARDQMVGPWQVPVADCAVTLVELRLKSWARPWPWASARRWRCSTAPASGAHGRRRGDHQHLRRACRALGYRLSANWMCAAGEPGEGAALYDTVRAVGMEFCPALGICIPWARTPCPCRRAGRTGRVSGPSRRRCH
jgi:phosphoribosylformylglycinamidine synthase